MSVIEAFFKQFQVDLVDRFCEEESDRWVVRAQHIHFAKLLKAPVNAVMRAGPNFFIAGIVCGKICEARFAQKEKFISSLKIIIRLPIRLQQKFVILSESRYDIFGDNSFL